MAGRSGTARFAPRGVAAALAVLAVALPVIGWFVYHQHVHIAGGPDRDAHIVSIELAGRSAPDYVSSVHDLRISVGWDFAVIAGYGLGLLAAVRARAALETSHKVTLVGAMAVAIAVLADIAENIFLLAASRSSVHLFECAAVAATIKFCALVPAVVVAVSGLAAALRAAFARTGAPLTPGTFVAPTPLNSNDPILADGPRLDQRGPAETARWQRAYGVPTCHHDTDPAIGGSTAPHRPLSTAPGTDVIGIGLSGGGIRAASTAFGVLQSTRFRAAVVARAKYLVSVSGGGYTSGAFAQFLTDASEPAATATPPNKERAENAAKDRSSTAFLVGTPEEDYVRRHSSYLADTPGLMVAALGVIFWHLILTLTLMFGTAALAGIAVGRFYRAVPLAGFDSSIWTGVQHGVSPAFPAVRDSSFLALGILLVLATLAWLGVQWAFGHETETLRLRRFAEALTAIAIVAAVLTIAAPAVIWASAWFLHHTRSGGLQVLTPVASVLFTYVSSISALLWKNKAKLSKRKSTAPSAVPSAFARMSLAIAGNVVLALSWLVLAGGMATIGLHALDTTTEVIVAVLAVVVVFLGGFADETTLSLHHFYRGRLANSFALRRRTLADGSVVAEPYDRAERTTLSRYGTYAPGTEFPHVIFAASATLGGHRAPPGQNRVSYTLCSHWVGGPDVGWFDTAQLEQLAPPRLKRDLTVQGAVALSGAAIAASTGGQGTAWYETLFVLTGARLGAWMPNPAVVIQRQAGGAEQVGSALPRTRRLGYLLRELVGVHSASDPLLQVTDGGFYDNLGLLELFRRGCTDIYCVDASGDSPPTAATLAQTLLVARRELGVEVEVPTTTWSTYTAGSGEALNPLAPLEALSQRLAQSGLIDVSFTYPDCGPAPGRAGRLVVAKATLWAGLGYPLLSYAQGSSTFPNDSTADQFFDADHYVAYTELGRRLGDAIVDAINADAPQPVGRRSTDDRLHAAGRHEHGRQA